MRKRGESETEERVKGKRFIVLGCPGSGKTAFSLKLAAKSGIPLFHLDDIWWRQDKTTVPRETFDRELSMILKGEEWIVDGDYPRTAEVRLKACDTAVFLDVDEKTCVEGVLSRTGKKRPGTPFVDETPDPALLERVRAYRAERRPAVLSLLEKYPGKRIFIFRSREEAEARLEEL